MGHTPSTALTCQANKPARIGTFKNKVVSHVVFENYPDGRLENRIILFHDEFISIIILGFQE